MLVEACRNQNKVFNLKQFISDISIDLMVLSERIEELGQNKTQENVTERTGLKYVKETLG